MYRIVVYDEDGSIKMDKEATAITAFAKTEDYSGNKLRMSEGICGKLEGCTIGSYDISYIDSLSSAIDDIRRDFMEKAIMAKTGISQEQFEQMKDSIMKILGGNK